MESASTPAAVEKRVDGFSLGLFGAALLLAGLSMGLPPRGSSWADALLVVLITFLALASLTRELPLQNVIAVAAIIGLFGGVATAVGTVAHLPFGPLRFDAAGPKLFNVLPWAIPMVWISVILTARGVARLVLRSRRSTPFYGFWLIGLASLLSLILDVGVETWADGVKDYWSWRSTAAAASPHGSVPASLHFSAWFVSSAILLIAIVPWMIRKKPGEPPADFRPLLVWIFLNVWFASAAFQRALVIAGTFSACAALVVPWIAVRRVKPDF